MGSAIKAERLRLGVTQEELAWRADMHRTYLADIERGVRNVTLRSIANLARALEVSVASLLVHSDSGKVRQNRRAGLGEILLVEDDPADVELALHAFKEAKFANPIKVVRDGQEVLNYLHCRGRYAGRRSVTPELVLLDLNLPGISGLDVLRDIKSHRQTRHIPVVVLTVSREDRNIIECSRLGADHYIIKPVEFENFSRVTPKLNLQWTLVRPGGGAGGASD